MPADQDITRSSASGQETAWLSQYYTNSKTEEDLGVIAPDDGPAAAELLAPTSSEKYAISGPVGVGGMKTVHRAHDHNANRDVALAQLRKDAPRASQELRFLREARITAALEHPNIVPVHEIGLDTANHPYFTMKLLGGENLHNILSHIAADDAAYCRQYPLGRRLEIFQNVCHAIAFAHSRGVIHLDLKPANIQVASFGEVLVLDWGLAKVLEPGPFLAANVPIELPERLRQVHVAGTVSGTPGYMAPEQAQGDFPTLDQRTDIYALGAVLQALVNGRQSVRTMQRPRKVPQALEAIVAKAMAPDPHQRYQKVEDLARDVRAFLGGYAVSAQNIGLGALFWLLVKRHKAISIVIAVSLVTITTLLTVFVIQITRSERRALNALMKTLQSERQAQDALTRLREEQAEKLRLGRYATPQLLGHAEELIRNLNYEEALAELNLIVTLNSSLPHAWLLKGSLHLGRQEFEEAALAFDHLPLHARRAKRDNALRAGEIADKYQQLLLENETLPYPQLRQLIGDITNKTNSLPFNAQQATLGQLFQHVNHASKLDEAHWEFIRDALCWFNPQLIMGQSRSAENNLVLELHGNQVSQILPLTGLPIETLDLSGTAVLDLHWLRNSGVESLNLGGTPVNDLTALFNLPITNLGLINCANIQLEQLRNFPKLEKVSVSSKQLITAQRVLAKSRPQPEVLTE